MKCDPLTGRAGAKTPWLIILSLILAVAAANSQELVRTVEFTGGQIGPSFADDAAWGWWNPAKYDLWQADGDDSFDLVGLRFEVPGNQYTGIFSVEFYPGMRSDGVQYEDDGSVFAEHEVKVEITSYDLGWGKTLQPTRSSRFMPWIGLSYFDIRERRLLVGRTDLPADRANSRLWGASLGINGVTELTDKLSLSGRLVARWATGQRKATFIPEVSYGLPEPARAKASDTVDRAMWGGELGLRWRLYSAADIEGGWTYRDWTFDDGPGTYDGYYLRFLFHL